MAVDIKEEDKFAQVIVPDDQLSLAIGKAGQNARLAAKLTGWKIDIKSESQFREMLQKQQEQEENEEIDQEVEEQTQKEKPEENQEIKEQLQEEKQEENKEQTEE